MAPGEPNAETLLNTVTSTLEQAAFLMAEAMDASAAMAPADDCYQARIAFGGGAKGHLVLVASSALGEEVAANLLGLDSDAPEVQARKLEALAEILNMIGGSAMQTCLQAREPVVMAAPQVEPIDEPEALLRQAHCRVRVLVEDRLPLDVAIFLDSPP